MPGNTKAVPGDVITKDLALKTGGDSRAELELPDLTITRVGANALFRFLAGKRQIILDGGTMLFHAPKGAGGGRVEAGAITAAVTGTDFLISNINKRVKVICLSGRFSSTSRRIPRKAGGLSFRRFRPNQAAIEKNARNQPGCSASRQILARSE